MYIFLVIFEEHGWPDELNVKMSLKLHKYSCIKDGEKENSDWPCQLCTGVCKERTWAREAEESPLLEAVAREPLVKI
jgi:hypothetical protein